MKKQTDREQISERRLSRRGFIKRSAGFAVGLGLGCAAPNFKWISNALAAFPVSGGYLLVDNKKCQGCLTCMLACSLVNEGTENLSLSRIQVLQNPFARFPEDLYLAQCRQCGDRACVRACPNDSLHVDTQNSNVRRVDSALCIGCGKCVKACPFTPARPVVNIKSNTAVICDLCLTAAHWIESGGPNGKQACIESCPMRAITFSTALPIQTGDDGYTVNLRTAGWQKLGYIIE